VHDPLPLERILSHVKQWLQYPPTEPASAGSETISYYSVDLATADGIDSRGARKDIVVDFFKCLHHTNKVERIVELIDILPALTRRSKTISRNLVFATLTGISSI
jgi:hypothetical protein